MASIEPHCATRELHVKCKFVQKEDSDLNEVDATGMHNSILGI